MNHLCSVPGCGVPIAPHLLMCLDHWKRVPPLLQSQVYISLRQYRKGKATIEQLQQIRAKATDAAAEASAVKGGVS